MELNGLHHVTAICGEPQGNVDFYAGRLGLRLVKVTVNFDDPGSYHLYYGDELGSPGSALTFFVWPGAPKGRIGPGETQTIGLSVPVGGRSFWEGRLRDLAPTRFERFGESGLALVDPVGIRLELIETEDPRPAWTTPEIRAEHAIPGFHSVTLATVRTECTARVLQAMGYRKVGEEQDRTRFAAGAAIAPALIDLIRRDPPVGTGGNGTIHHVAFSTPSDASQAAAQEELKKAGLHPTPVQERQYFRSIYYREPGGVLFEIATQGPGFTIDESLAELGTALKLPPWFESSRETIRRHLPSFVTPGGVKLP